MGRKLSAEEKAKLKEEYIGKAEAGFERMFGEGKLDELKGSEEVERLEKPEPLVRTAAAAQQKIEEFGWMTAAEARKRGFYEAKRKAFVGDGGNGVDPFGALHFPDWIQVLDFMHGMTH